jgi:hypothetical protein
MKTSAWKKVLFGGALLAAAGGAQAFAFSPANAGCIANGASNSTCGLGTLRLGTLYTNEETFAGVGAGMSFTHSYVFAVPGDAEVAAGASQTQVRLFDNVISGISSLDVALYDAADSRVGTDAGREVFAGVGAGTYRAVVTGSVVGAPGGNGQYAFTVAAVPVPAAVWLFGAGLAGLAIVARRRNHGALDAENVAAA